jgi:hypothetical protein
MRREVMLLSACVLLAGCGGAKSAATPTDSVVAAAATDSAKALAARKAGPPVRHVAIDTATLTGERPLMRETYTYEGTARDPFKAMVVSVQRGPELPDLKLVAIIYDSRSPSNSLVTFREIGSDRRYSWRPGERFGRITVGDVSSTDVTLMQDDFGVVHRQTYTLRKTEDGNP